MISKMNYDDIPASQTAAKTGATVDALARAYLRSVRAAEMAMWEMTGGDYVLSRFAPKRTQSPGNFSLLAGS